MLLALSQRHLFFPTTFHVNLSESIPTGTSQSQQFLKHPERYRATLDNLDIRRDWATIPLDTAFEVTGAWRTSDTRVSEVLDAFHCYGPGFVEKRLGGREGGVSVLEVRVWKLGEANVVRVENVEGLWGCFSWVDDVAGEVGEGVACVGDAEWQERQRGVREALEGLEGVEALL